MKEVELFKRGTAQTLIPLAEKAEKHLSSPLSSYAEVKHAISEQTHSGTELYFAKVTGEGMTASGIYPNDMLVVDQNLEPMQGDIVIGEKDGSFILRSYYKKDGREYLLADNTYFKPVEITGNDRYRVWGVVPHSLIDERRRNNARIHRFEQLLR
jgi:DNA polymerase V